MQFSQEKLEPEVWNNLVAALPGAHVLQTWQWGEVKSRVGWQPFQVTWQDEPGHTVAAALLLQRTIPIRGFAARLCVLYIPKGPLLDWNNAVLRRCVLGDLALLARQRGAIFIKIDPDVFLGFGIPGQPDALENPTGQAVVAELQATGWRLSAEQIQFRNTVLIDLSPNPQELLVKMKQKTRYNIRLAERKGVVMRVGSQSDLAALYRMYAETSVRDGFVIRDQAYYQAVWSAFIQAGIAEPLIAEIDGEMAAAVIIFRFARKAWYLYGMSRDAHREKMPNYLLQWQAMQRARQAGCTLYDLWGAPDEFIETDSLWGVYRFKEGLGGQVVRGLGAWDLPTRPFYYRLYTQFLPRLLDIMRRRGKEQTKRMVGA
jgi:peptidoglycan pentaglycine glycine transferase (the first glycine)